jgi:hypothetical protein
VTLKRVACHTNPTRTMSYTPATCTQGYGRVPPFYLLSDPLPSPVYPPQIHDYPHFLHELTRILRPGGVLILIEFELRPIADGKFASAHAKSGIPGWCALAEEIQRALTLSGVDVTVPRRMGKLVHDIGWYDQVYQQHADIPVGFWPKGTYPFS